MVRRSARLAKKSGLRPPDEETLSTISTGSTATAGGVSGTSQTWARFFTWKRLGAFTWNGSPSGSSLQDDSVLRRVFLHCNTFVGKILLVGLLLLLLGLGAWFLFANFPALQSLFAAAFATLDMSHVTGSLMRPFAFLQQRDSKWSEDRSRQMKVLCDPKNQRTCRILECRPLIKAEINRMQRQLSKLRSHLFNVRWASLGILQKAKVLFGLLDSGHVVVKRPDLQRALEELKKEILDRLRQEQDKQRKDIWRKMGETPAKEDVGAVTLKDVERIVRGALSLYRADGIGMADYALESSGASVIRSSETYHKKSVTLFGFNLWYPSNSPNTIIQPETHPGQCWPVQGSKGFAVIALSYPVQVTHVSLEHLPRGLSPTGGITSAPKDFALYGLLHEDQHEGVHLGTFTFNQDGESIQTFKLPGSHKDVYHLVELRILSNWGHPEYTCVYRFRVHGCPQST